MRRSWTTALVPALGCALGLLFVFYPIFLDGFRLTHGGQGDSRLVNYTLEHGYRWLVQMAGHESFWNPPIFYPYPNVSAFTELMIGAGPFYWIWRILGFEPDSSFQLWMLTIWALNYVAAYFLLRKGFFTRPLAAACGALVFAFGTTAQAHFAHPQLAPLFYIAIALLAVLEVFRQEPENQVPGGKAGWIAVFFGCVTLQAYTCFYTFFFFGLLLAVAGIWALVLPASRSRFIQTLNQQRRALLLGTLFCALALGYMASHFLITADNLGVRQYDPNKAPSWVSWFRVDGRNYLYGWLNRLAKAQDWSLGQGRNGMGLIPLGLSIFAFYQYRRNTAVRLLLMGCITMIVLTTSWGGYSFWQTIHAIVPGAAALRALARVGIILRLPAAIGVALGLQVLLERRRRALVAVLILLCFAEIPHGHIWVDKTIVRQRVAQLAELVDPTSEAFFMICTGPRPDPHLAENAEWVGLMTGVPTINGRYGNFPPNFDLRPAQENAVLTEEQRREYKAALRRWCESSGLDCERVQWIEYEKVKIPRVRYRARWWKKAGKKRRETSSPIP